MQSGICSLQTNRYKTRKNFTGLYTEVNAKIDSKKGVTQPKLKKKVLKEICKTVKGPVRTTPEKRN